MRLQYLHLGNLTKRKYMFSVVLFIFFFTILILNDQLKCWKCWCWLLPYIICQHKLWVQWFTLWYALYFLRSKHMIHFLVSMYKLQWKTGNNASEFTYSNWITQSYYSSPKHRSPLHRYDTLLRLLYTII